jgi:hypothetical protein
MTIESSSEAYYNINIPSNGYGGFRIHTTPTADQDAAFEYYASNKQFYFLVLVFLHLTQKVILKGLELTVQVTLVLAL